MCAGDLEHMQLITESEHLGAEVGSGAGEGTSSKVYVHSPRSEAWGWDVVGADSYAGSVSPL